MSRHSTLRCALWNKLLTGGGSGATPVALRASLSYFLPRSMQGRFIGREREAPTSDTRILGLYPLLPRTTCHSVTWGTRIENKYLAAA